MHGGVRVEDVLDRIARGEPLTEVAEDFGVPLEDSESSCRQSPLETPEFYRRPQPRADPCARGASRAGWTLRPHGGLRSWPGARRRPGCRLARACGRGLDRPHQGPSGSATARRRVPPLVGAEACRRSRLPGGNLSAPGPGRAFRAQPARSAGACREPGPFVYAVHAERIVRDLPA